MPSAGCESVILLLSAATAAQLGLAFSALACESNHRDRKSLWLSLLTDSSRPERLGTTARTTSWMGGECELSPTFFLFVGWSVVLVVMPRAVGRVERGDWSLDLALIDRLSGLTRRGWNYSSKLLLSNFEMGICSDGRSPL